MENGRSFGNAFYRPFFILQALASFALLAAYLGRLPGKTLYPIRGPWAWLMNGTRFAALLYGAWAVWEFGMPRLMGIPGLTAWRKHAPEVPPEPEAQGPVLAGKSRMKVTGSFRDPVLFGIKALSCMNGLVQVLRLHFQFLRNKTGLGLLIEAVELFRKLIRFGLDTLVSILACMGTISARVGKGRLPSIPLAHTAGGAGP